MRECLSDPIKYIAFFNLKKKVDITYQRPRNEGTEAIASKQLKDSLSVASADHEDSTNEELTA